MNNQYKYDVIIIGGSYAGLSAALALGRSLRKVLIIDGGEPCNKQTPHSHNFLTQDGATPAVIAAKGREQVLQYNTVKWLNGMAVEGKRSGEDFIITTEKGEEYKGARLLFATGIKDVMPSIGGFAECWGISVIHCPYCHGFEFRGKKTGILANGERAFHLATLVKNLTGAVTIFSNGKADFTPEQNRRLEMNGIEMIETAVLEFQHEHGQIKSVLFENGSRKDFDAVYAALSFTQHCDIPASLGCELTEQGYIKVDAFQKTTVPGVYACGDNSAMMRSIAGAVYSGNLAGAMMNKELIDETFL